MNSNDQQTYSAPVEPPKVSTSRRTKWVVPVAILVICGTPSALLFWIHQYYYRIFQVTTSSMEPALTLGDHVWTDMHYFSSRAPLHGDIVLIRRPEGILIFKRVIALPGDTIQGRNGVVYLNGDVLLESYAQYRNPDPTFDLLRSFGPVKIGPEQCFVMGDNRDNSLDSRAPGFGLVPITTIIGKPLYIITSKEGFHRWERIK